MLWCAAIRGAVVHGTAQGPAAGLDLIPVGRREGWARHLGDAWSQPPSSFNPNGFCVTALQAAWSAVAHTPAHPGQIACRHLEDALAAAIRIGDDSADAVVSLCQVGWADFPAVPPRDHLQIWLAEHPGDNNNPHYAVDQAARAVAARRGQARLPALPHRAIPRPGDQFAQILPALPPPESVHPTLRASAFAWALRAADPMS